MEGQVGGLKQVGPISFRLVRGVATCLLYPTAVCLYSCRREEEEKSHIILITLVSNTADFVYVTFKAILEDNQKTKSEKIKVVGVLSCSFSLRENT